MAKKSELKKTVADLCLCFQLCAGGQRLPHHAVWVQQPLHPDLGGERSRQDRGFEENPAVLRSQLSEHQTPEQRPGQATPLQPSAWGQWHAYLSAKASAA